MAADFAELESLKQKGNKQYVAKNYTEALKLYDAALESIALSLPQTPSSLSAVVDGHSEFYREIAVNLEDPSASSIDKAHRVTISKILSNRAACNLNLKQFNDCIHSANLSLLYDANNENALFRRGFALEKLSKTRHALQCYQRLLAMNAPNKKAQTACKRMQSLVTTKSSAKTKYTESIEALRAVLDSIDSETPMSTESGHKVIGHIATVMQQLMDNKDTHFPIVAQLGFTHILHSILSVDSHSVPYSVRTECARALNGVLSTVGMLDRYNVENEGLIVDAFGVKLIESVLEMSTRFLSKLLAHFEGPNTKQNDIEIEPKEVLFHRVLVELMVKMASSPYLFETHSDSIFGHLLDYFKKLKYQFIGRRVEKQRDKVLGNMSGTVKGTTTTAPNGTADCESKENEEADDYDESAMKAVSDILVSILKELSKTAHRHGQRQYKLLEKIRYIFLFQFLFSDLSVDSRIKEGVVRYFVCCSGLKSAFDEVNDEKLGALKSKYEQRISEAVTAPLVQALKSRQFGSGNVRLVKAPLGTRNKGISTKWAFPIEK